MNAKLLRCCAALWVLGLLGMWFVRAVLVLEPHAWLFQLAAGFWILGGLGYAGLGLLGLEADERAAAPERAPADLSAWIRRQ